MGEVMHSSVSPDHSWLAPLTRDHIWLACSKPNTLGARGFFFFRSEAAIVSGESCNLDLGSKNRKKKEKIMITAFAAHNRSFAMKKKPSGTQLFAG